MSPDPSIHGSGGVSGTLSIDQGQNLERVPNLRGAGDYSRAIAEKKLQELADARHANHPEEKASTSYSKVLLDPANAEIRKAALVA